MLKNSFAAALAEEHLVAYEHVSGTELSRLYFRDEAIGLGKRPHYKPSVSETPSLEPFQNI